MRDQILPLLITRHIKHHTNQDILIASASEGEGMQFVSELLCTIIDQQAVLFLSGGRTPKNLYTTLSVEEKIHPGAVAMIDERYGEPFHETSNERMLEQTGLLRYLQIRDIPFYPILSITSGIVGLQSDHKVTPETGMPSSRQNTALDTAKQYDTELRELFATYRKAIGILGIGLDGHTAGLPADPEVWKEYDLEKRSKTEMIVEYDDHGKFYNQRVSMSTLGLSMLDLLVVLVFGDDKKRSLDLVFAEGLEQDVPGRFFKRADIASKTIIITDQAV
jgi:6-phosphogluconolactonase/glucosamine-6-phosphate isomerase/deaminase